MLTAERYHDISAGHRVVGHEGKCKNLHGHNYRIHFSISSDRKDGIGRIIDFGIIKSLLCVWLEDNWDHRMLIWEKDPLLGGLLEIDPDGICVVPFNPTAENMAEYILHFVGPKQLMETGAVLTEVLIEETRKCSVRCKK